MTRDELISFIKHIRGKDHVIVDEYISRTMFTPRVDKTPWLCKMVKKLKSVPFEKCYSKLANYIRNGGICNQALYPDLCFSEDLYEHLLKLGFEEREATHYTKIVASGQYKKYIRQGNKGLCLPSTLHDFCLSCWSLPSRDFIKSRLYTEYGIFSKKKTFN
ncbi:MAG: hypothetical protein IJ004_00375 [Clostridia bacterium]|nr:hypothetical protein [Clostridia bacterium]